MAKKVLIIDDELSIRFTLCEFIKELGYQVELAASADEAMELVRHHHFDLVATDIYLPRMNGIDLLREIQEFDKNIQAIVMTGEPTEESVKVAKSINVKIYLPKPISKKDIQQAVRQALR